MTLISAPAGFGKTTLVSEWIASSAGQGSRFLAAWLSLDEDDNDPARFLTYLIAALRTLAAHLGNTVLNVLQSPRHLVIATREYLPLPRARLRARGQLAELHGADRRFTVAEAGEFLNTTVGLQLSLEDIAKREDRTEGWIAGLQLAALSMQGQPDLGGFIRSFTGSHRFVLDYLLEEVLERQPEHVHDFLLRTSLLDQLCGHLCEAALGAPAGSGQATLEHLERANLLIVPLDNERRWYRYHHLFADLLRQRLQHWAASPAGPGAAARALNELHGRASQWYEENGLDIEAFQHAAAAHDVERAELLIEGKGLPLHLRGAVKIVLDWLEAMPDELKWARPSLWWRHAALLLVNGQTIGVEEKLRAAEAALPAVAPDDRTRLLIGRNAAARAVLALTRYDADTMLSESRRAPENLPAHRLSMRANAL